MYPYISSHLLLTHFTGKLKHHMTCTCVTKKHGTVLYRHGSDLMHELSSSLSDRRKYQKRMQGDVQPQNSDSLSQACKILNHKFHKQMQNTADTSSILHAS